MDILNLILGSKARSEIFRVIFGNASKEHYVRDLHRQTSIPSVSHISTEITKLLKAGLVKVRKDGNRSYYSANTSHPLFPEIRSLVEKTTGFHALLKTALTHSEIKIAFIFGSVASGKAKPESDLDLFVIGDIGLRKLSNLLDGLSERIGREINPQVMPEKEFAKKISNKNHFITSLLDSDKQFLIGDEDELRRLGKE